VPAAAPRVDFYVLPGTEARARLKFACRVAEKAYLAGQRVFVWLEDAAELQSFDDLLWTFADRSFVPHEIYGDARQWQDTPVLLGWQTQPQQRAGRNRFRHYRELGLAPETHTMAAEETP